MTEHLFAKDLVELGWDPNAANAAEDALRALAPEREPFDQHTECASGLECATLELGTDETTAIPRFSADSETTSLVRVVKR